MTLLTVDISQNLLSTLKGKGRPARDTESTANDPKTGTTKTLRRKRKQTLPQTELSREEVRQLMIKTGFICDPSELDTPEAREWRNLPEEEKQQHLKEMAEMWFPDSPASRAISENRR